MRETQLRPELSRSRVSRAGEALVAANAEGQEFPKEECEIVAEWRRRHAAPLVWITTALQNRLEANPSYRLKRLPQIVSKLARAQSMNLARMQDIGGARVIVDSVEELDDARVRLERRAAPHYEVVRVSDYVAEGRRDTGYRGLHLILRRDGLLIEVQLRTQLQHAWAEAVERAANRTGFDLKAGDGPEPVLEFFRLASDCLSLQDHGAVVPPTKRKRLTELEKELYEHLRERPSGDLPERRVAEKHFSTVTNNWLLIYNWNVGKLEFWLDCGTDAEDAAERYAAYEARFRWTDGYEVVLLGSDSKETIEWTHAHYFGRSADDLDPHGVFRRLLAS